MPYNQFSFKRVREQFELSISDANLYHDVAPFPLEAAFLDYFDKTRTHATTVNTEKAKSEWIIAPLLFQAKLAAGESVRLFSGIELDVDPNRGLNGVCDFVFSRGNSNFFLTAPVLTVVEAKNDNIGDGIGQCIAEMIAAREYNEKDREGLPGQVVHGVVTTGSLWMFMRLDKQAVTLDTQEYTAMNPEKVVGILTHILAQSAPQNTSA